MTETDDIILELLADSNAVLNKRGLEINLSEEGEKISYSSLQRHLPRLEKAGLVEKVVEEGSWYKITGEGREYLEGNFDARDIDKPD